MTARAQHARALAGAPRPNDVADGPSPEVQRAKPLKLELSLQLRRAREHAGLTQEQLATAVGTARTTLRRWESPESRDVPNITHLAIAPRDWALPLLRWAAEQHERELRAVVDPSQLEAEARAACLDLLRAFEASCERKRGELIERAALRVANASRAVLAARNCR
jgi:transcriptional regulator with XRE-family HTH domain